MIKNNFYFLVIIVSINFFFLPAQSDDMFNLGKDVFLTFSMKKILILIFCLVSFNSYAVEKTTTFNREIFKKAQEEGKTVVINSWNKYCFTCKKQIKILDKAEKEFKDVLFLSYEQKNNSNRYKEEEVKIIRMV